MFKQYYVERPATLCIPLLLATFSLSRGSKVYASDFFALHTDIWLTVYWVLLCTTLVYLLVFGARALLVLRHDPRSRRIANLYLLWSAVGVAACTVRIVTAVIPPFQTPPESVTQPHIRRAYPFRAMSSSAANMVRVGTPVPPLGV